MNSKIDLNNTSSLIIEFQKVLENKNFYLPIVTNCFQHVTRNMYIFFFLGLKPLHCQCIKNVTALGSQGLLYHLTEFSVPNIPILGNIFVFFNFEGKIQFWIYHENLFKSQLSIQNTHFSSSFSCSKTLQISFIWLRSNLKVFSSFGHNTKNTEILEISDSLWILTGTISWLKALSHCSLRWEYYIRACAFHGIWQTNWIRTGFCKVKKIAQSNVNILIIFQKKSIYSSPPSWVDTHYQFMIILQGFPG